MHLLLEGGGGRYINKMFVNMETHFSSFIFISLTLQHQPPLDIILKTQPSILGFPMGWFAGQVPAVAVFDTIQLPPPEPVLSWHRKPPFLLP